MTKRRTSNDLYVIVKTIQTTDENNPIEISVTYASKSKKDARQKLQKLKSIKRASWLPVRTFNLHTTKLS